MRARPFDPVLPLHAASANPEPTALPDWDGSNVSCCIDGCIGSPNHPFRGSCVTDRRSPASSDCASTPCGAEAGDRVAPPPVATADPAGAAPEASTAAEWVIRRHAEDWGPEDEQNWHRWCSASSLHEAAYLRAERLWAELGGLKHVPELLPAASPPGELATRPPAGRSPSRRVWAGSGMALAALLAVLTATGGSPMLALQADQRTAVGESRDVDLPDGSRVRLAADSAIAVHYSATERRVELLKGEALFEAQPVGTTHPAGAGSPESRPFVVAAADGSTRALGTRFIVERLATHTRVVGVEHRVAVSLAARPQAATTLSPGQLVRYDAQGLGPVEAVSAPWLEAEAKGLLVFERMRLDDVVQRLNRHFPGRIMLRGDALARREVSGVFPAADVEGVLAALQSELGLRALRLPDLVLLY